MLSAPDNLAIVVSFPDGAPVLTDGEVVLRAPDAGDIARLVEMSTDPEFAAWTSVPRPFGRQEAHEFLARAATAWDRGDAGGRWVIESAERPGVLVGRIGLRLRAGGTVSLGFGLHPDARGRGWSERAVRLACAYAVAQGAPRVHWTAFVGNWASRRVAWACGFTYHGLIQQDELNGDGRLVSTWHASLGAHEPMAPTAPWHRPVELEGDGIRLRPWREDDAPHCQPLTDPAHYMPPAAAPTPETFTGWLLIRRERMAAGNSVLWCIADERSDVPLGMVVLMDREGALTGPSAEIGYFLFPRGRGRGVVREAIRITVAHGFAGSETGGLGLSRIDAVTAPDNAASNAALASTGFTPWGTAHADYRLADGALGDSLHWELLAGS